MSRIGLRIRVFSLVITFLTPVATPALGQQTKPLLSDTIRAVMDRDGVEIARKRFAEIYPAHVTEYRIDMREMAQLGSGYMQAGDMARGQAVMEMVTTLAQASMATNLATSGGRPTSEARPRRRETDGQRAERLKYGGQPLADDVAERYEGVYADPAESDATRRFFLARDPCGPQMMFGAMWGDAENTYLRVESDDVLAQPPEQVRFGQPLRIEVGFDADGRAVRLTHGATWAASPLVRQGELPAEWRNQACTGR